VHTQVTFALNQEILGPRCQVEEPRAKGAHEGRTGLTITTNVSMTWKRSLHSASPDRLRNSVGIHTSCSVSECNEREESTSKNLPSSTSWFRLRPGLSRVIQVPASSKRGQRREERWELLSIRRHHRHSPSAICISLQRSTILQLAITLDIPKLPAV
jgi:hypothetical protein